MSKVEPFLIARSIPPISWGFTTTVKICYILLEMSFKVYRMNKLQKLEVAKIANVPKIVKITKIKNC